jgi:hypothetical protein
VKKRCDCCGRGQWVKKREVVVDLAPVFVWRSWALLCAGCWATMPRAAREMEEELRRLVLAQRVQGGVS